MSTAIKVYVVQRVLADGTDAPEIVALKLTFAAAHTIAREHAPARVKSFLADKSSDLNGDITLYAAEQAAAGDINGSRGH